MALIADHKITNCNQALALGASSDDILLTVVPSSTEPFTHTIVVSVNHIPKVLGALSVFNLDIGPENTVKLVSIIVTFFKTPVPATTSQTVNAQVTLTKNGLEVGNYKCTGANPTVVYEELDVILS